MESSGASLKLKDTAQKTADGDLQTLYGAVFGFLRSEVFACLWCVTCALRFIDCFLKALLHGLAGGSPSLLC